MARLPAQQTHLSNPSGQLTLEWYRALSAVTVNANKTENLTLSGDLTFIGAYNTTVTLTGDTDITFPVSGILASLSLPQTWSAVQSFDHNDLVLLGATSGSLVLNAAAVAGSHTITFPAGSTDFTATGGASDVVRQNTLGGPLTVGQLGFTDLSGVIASGQVSGAYGGITGVGTIATGVWNATLIGPTYGGTGVNNGSNTLTVSSSTTIGRGQYLGTATNDNAAAGYIGEYIKSNIPAGSAVTLTLTLTAYEITHIDLTVGDWDVRGIIHFTPPGTAGTSWFTGICGTTATIPTLSDTIDATDGPTTVTQNPAGTNIVAVMAVGIGRVSLASNGSVYLNAEMAFTGTAPTAYGYISARRVR